MIRINCVTTPLTIRAFAFLFHSEDMILIPGFFPLVISVEQSHFIPPLLTIIGKNKPFMRALMGNMGNLRKEKNALSCDFTDKPFIMSKSS